MGEEKEPGGDVEEVAAWLSRPEIRLAFGDAARTGKTALKRLAGMRAAADPPDLAWMLAHLEEMGDRLVASGLSSSTAKTYAARAATMLKAFEEWKRDPTAWAVVDRRFRPEDEPPPAADLEDEMRQAYEWLGRWPRLREKLWPPLESLIRKHGDARG